jgi:single-stranded-DNA-specific exonuclease
MTLEPGQVDAFRDKFEAIVAATIPAELLVPEIVIDASISLQDIKWSFYNILCQMEPFGPENLRPVFVAQQVMDTGYSRIVKEQHVKFSVRQGDTIINGIGFGMADKFPLLQLKQPVDIVFKIDENEWNGEKNLQVRVVDLRLSNLS